MELDPAEELEGSLEHGRCGTEMPWGDIYTRRPSGDFLATSWMAICWISGCNAKVPREDELGLCPSCIEYLRTL